MQNGNFNMQDPAVQEKIRRGPHEYVEGGGRHGTYVALKPTHQEYPKVMDRTPPPVRKDFKDEALFDAARKDWDATQQASIVKNKNEEERWLRAHPEVKAA